METYQTEVEELEEVVKEGESEREAEGACKWREEGEERGEVAREKVPVKELPEAQDVEAARP